MGNFKYEITEKIGTLSERGDWSKELNKVSWNGREAKFDIRDWNHSEGKMRKGVTLTADEIEVLKSLL